MRIVGGVHVAGIEVVGRACRLPGANSVEEFWRLLLERRCSVTRVPEERFAQSWYFNRRRGEPGKSYTFAAGVIDDIWGFDPAVFSITPREARQMDPQQRLVLQLVWEALEDAGVPASSLARRNIGVYVGASSMDHSHRQYFDPAGTDSYLMTGNTLSLLSNRVSYQFDLTGPSITIDTACSSSLVALDYAMQDLRIGKIDAAIVGGINGLLSPFNFMGFCAAAMLSPDGLCRAFDHRANGYVRSEGGVIMVLQRSGERFAPGRVHGEILASAMNSDGRTSGVALPSMEQQAELLRSLYTSAGIDPERLAFVEAHGTGTLVGDPVECHALGKVLGTARSADLPIGSAKSNVGHLEPASGMVGLLKAQLALEHGILPATLHVEARNPNIPFDELKLQVATDPLSLAELPSSRHLAGVNNFGFGGTNVHVIIAPSRDVSGRASIAQPVTPAVEIASHDDDDAFVLLSAQCRDGLAALARRHLDALGNEAGYAGRHSVCELGNAVAHRRDLLTERLVIAARGAGELRDALGAFTEGVARPGSVNGAAVARSAKTAFVFSGNGAQWAGMGRAALDRSKIFARHFRAIDEAYRTVADISLGELILEEDLAEALSRTEVAQPLLFAVQVALARSLIERGLQPAAVIGHSVGEVAGAHICGALSLEQAVTVIRARSHHQEIVRDLGRMAAVQAAPAAAEALISEAGLEHVVVAAINSPRSVTVAGDGDEVQRLIEFARGRHVAGKLLDIRYPFHSACLDPAREPLLEALSGLQPSKTAVPFYSTVSGALIEAEMLDAEYWWRNVRETVRFQEAINAAARDGAQVFVEIGPRPILLGYISDCTANADQETRVIPTFEASDDACNVDPVSVAIGRALVAGARFDVDRLFGPQSSATPTLPLYPWQNKPFRMTPSPEALGTFGSSHVQHPLLGARLRGDHIEWERQLDTSVLPYLADHKIGNRVIMPGTGYVEIALAAAILHLKSERIELRDVDFLQALELFEDGCQNVHTRLEPESATISIAARARLSTDERQTHMRTRFARLPSEAVPMIDAPPRETSLDAPPRDDMYRLAARFHLNYGPMFQRMTACREIGEHLIEVELSGAPDDGSDYFLHPVDFDACLHGLNTIYSRLEFGENKLSFVPVRIGALRLFRPRTRIDRARIKVAQYSTRGAVADFELFGSDGALVATAHDVRLRAASLVHRIKLGQAAYHVGSAMRALPADSREPVAPPLDMLLSTLDAEPSILSMTDRTSLEENRLLVELAARSIRSGVDQANSDRREGGINGAPLHLHDEAVQRLDGGAVMSRNGGASHGHEACVPHAEGQIRLISVNGVSPPAKPREQFPPLEEIVASILEDDPSWSAECLMLLNAAEHAAASSRIAAGDLVNPPAHGAATIEHFRLDAPRSRAEVAAVAAVVRAAVDQASPDHAFRILQLGGSGGGLTRELIPLASDGRVHITVADIDARQIARLTSQWQHARGVHFIACKDDLTELSHVAHFDLVVAHNGLSALPARRILARLPSLLAERALMIVSEREPDVFHSLIFGGTPSEGAASGSAISLQDRAAWSAALEATGFDTVRPCAANLAVPGTTLLLAQIRKSAGDTLTGDTGGVAEGPQPRGVMVLAREDGTSSFGQRLERCLGDQGLTVMGSIASTAMRANGAPVTGANDNGVHANACNGDGIHIDTVAAKEGPSIDAGSDWASLVERSGSIDDLVFAIDGSAVRSTAHLPALMARLTSLSRLLKSMASRTARIWIVAEGGARSIAGLGQACPVQTGVWSYVRTAINEFANLDLRLVDFCGDMRTDEKAERLARLIGDPGHARELVLTRTSMVVLEVYRGVPAAPSSAAKLQAEESVAAVLMQRELGNLDELRWVRAERRAPAADEIEIEVTASGLNFRDVMWSMGLLPEEALENGFAGPTIGLECTGRIVRIGSGVSAFEVGDPVIAIAPASFASHVTVAARAVGRLPSNVGLREAASIPVSFLTACYGLEYLARLRRGEWVLVHGAAGGVGLAAVQVAKRNGARIIATAGSDEKRNFLRKLGADFVLDTRSLDFVDRVREITKEGVHVVLNSLAGEAMERSIELLRPFGRFVELGKRDFYASTKISLRPFRNNVSYFGVDADQLLTFEPDVAAQVLGSVLSGFEEGEFSALPCRIFKSHEVLDAFRLMQKSGHIGKIIVEAPTLARAIASTPREFVVSDRGYHVVFGGTGGFGLEYARWLADRGARHIVVASRSGGVGDDLRTLSDSLQSRGVSLARVACDVTDKNAVEALLDRLREERPVSGVTHTAMVLDDGLITALTPERVEAVLAPKVVGARNLDALTRGDDLDYFILFSSAAAMFGNPGQASYVAANGYLDGLARERRAQGRKALSVAWGAITDVGVLTRDKATAKSLARHTGGVDFTARDGLDLLAQILADEQNDGVANISLAAMNWAMAQSFLPIMGTPAYDQIRRDAEARGDAGMTGADLRTTVLSLDEAAAKKAVSDYLVKEVASIFRMPPEDINPKRSLTEIGMDSLMGLELRMAIERQIGVDIMKVSISGGTTINDIADHVASKLRATDADAEPATSEQALMISQHITEEVDLDALRQFERRVTAREADLRGGVL